MAPVCDRVGHPGAAGPMGCVDGEPYLGGPSGLLEIACRLATAIDSVYQILHGGTTGQPLLVLVG